MGTLGPFLSMCFGPEKDPWWSTKWLECLLAVTYELGWDIEDIWINPWENVIDHSGNYDCINLTQCTCIYVCNSSNYHLIHKYN